MGDRKIWVVNESIKVPFFYSRIMTKNNLFHIYNQLYQFAKEIT
jgi:hypothetical protein